MKNVLYLATSGAQLWRKSRAGWQAYEDPPDGPVWVVTNLVEESFDEIQIPRIFGRDRQGFIARQLASHFPDTPFSAALPIYPGGSFMDRIAPPRQALLGLDAASRVNAALDALAAPLAGVWTTSMLLTQIGSKKALPPNLFVVLPAVDALRIVFIKKRVPVLSRLIPGVTQASDQAAEITRTLRHLENTRVLDRNMKRHAVLLLGNPQGLTHLLAKDHMELIDAPAPWTTTPPTDWRFALFDLALTLPAGQLASLSRRVGFVATRLRAPSYGIAALGLGLALWVSGENLREIMANQSSQNEIQGHTQYLARQASAVEQEMAGFGVPANLVHRAVALDQEEIASAPSLPAQMQQLGQIIGQQPALRLSQFEWRMVPSGEVPCTRGAPTPASVPTEPVAEAAVPKRQVEISFDITMPQEQPAKARAQTVASLSARLAKLEGVALILDPAKDLPQATLSGGSGSASPVTEKTMSWCLALPGQTPSPEATLPNIKNIKP